MAKLGRNHTFCSPQDVPSSVFRRVDGSISRVLKTLFCLSPPWLQQSRILSSQSKSPSPWGRLSVPHKIDHGYGKMSKDLAKIIQLSWFLNFRDLHKSAWRSGEWQKIPKSWLPWSGTLSPTFSTCHRLWGLWLFSWCWPDTNVYE